MAKKDTIHYWIKTADKDWKVANHLFEEISDFNLEARYPDDKFSFYKKCTIGFTKNKLKQIRALREWFLQKL
ncbi:MAG: hypothetical protein KKE12_16645 [Proteobacteria bacterium]|nr:hypothetical protein [Pseudomonadota bacterium]